MSPAHPRVRIHSGLRCFDLATERWEAFGDSCNGSVFAVDAGPSGVHTFATLTSYLHWTGEEDHNQLGSLVAAGGDYNGDGYEDVLMGAPATACTVGF